MKIKNGEQELTLGEVSALGNQVLKNKIADVKRWFNERKNKKKN